MFRMNKKKRWVKHEELDKVPWIREEMKIPEYILDKRERKVMKKVKIGHAIRDERFNYLRNTLEKYVENEVLGRVTYISRFDSQTRNSLYPTGDYDSRLGLVKMVGEHEVEHEFTKVIYTPLSLREVSFVKTYFEPKIAKLILEGGRVVLKQEIEKIDEVFENRIDESTYSNILKSNEYNEIRELLNDFTALSVDEINYLKEKFPDYMVYNTVSRDLILHYGKKMYDSLLNLLINQEIGIKNILENLSFLRKYELENIEPSRIPDLSPNNLKNLEVSQVKKEENKEKINEILLQLGLDEDTIIQNIYESIGDSDYFNNLYNEGYIIDPDKYEITDFTIIRGLSEDRFRNFPPDCYLNYQNPQNKNIRIYKMKNQGELEKTPFGLNDSIYYERENQYLNNFNIVLRATIKLVVNKVEDNETETENESGDENTNTNNEKIHLILVDNELALPENKLHIGKIPYPELLKFYTYTPDKWNLIDVNNSIPNSTNLLPYYYEYDLLDLMNFWTIYNDENIFRITNVILNKENPFIDLEAERLEKERKLREIEEKKKTEKNFLEQQAMIKNKKENKKGGKSQKKVEEEKKVTSKQGKFLASLRFFLSFS